MKKKIAVICIILAAVAGGLYYHASNVTTFPDGAVLNGVSVSKMTAAEAADVLQEKMNDLTLDVDGREVKVNTDYRIKVLPLHNMIRRAAVNPYLWYQLRNGKTHKLEIEGTGSTAKALKKSSISNDRRRTRNARLDLDSMKIVKEVQGNQVDYDKLTEALQDKIEANPGKTDFKIHVADYCDKPTVRSNDEGLRAKLAFAKKYIAPGLRIKKPDGSVISVPNSQIAKAVRNKDGKPEYSLSGAKAIAKKYASYYIPGTVTIKTRSGRCTVANYAAVWYADTDATAENIIEALKGNNDRTAKMKMSGSNPVKEAKKNRVEISVSSQKATLIRNGKTVFTAKVVTGMAGVHDTPTGLYAVQSMSRNTELTGTNDDGSSYSSPVKYWMAFNGSIGMHDASWRSRFGGHIYKKNGSHGCVNMPASAAARMYRSIHNGYYVLVY